MRQIPWPYRLHPLLHAGLDSGNRSTRTRFVNAHLHQHTSVRHTNMHLELRRQRSRLVPAEEEEQSAEQNGAWDRKSKALSAYSAARGELQSYPQAYEVRIRGFDPYQHNTGTRALPVHSRPHMLTNIRAHLAHTCTWNFFVFGRR